MDKNGSIYDMQTRLKEIKEKYPEKIPVIVKKANDSKLLLPDDFRYKFIVNQDLTVAHFIMVLRKRINLDSNHGLFLFINDLSLPNSAPLKDIYKNHKGNDEFLRIIFREENHLGNHI
jgi:GABA(A) receptor-associated protein